MKQLENALEIYKEVKEIEDKITELQNTAMEVSKMQNGEIATLSVQYKSKEKNDDKEEVYNPYHHGLGGLPMPGGFMGFLDRMYSTDHPAWEREGTRKTKMYRTELTPEYILRVCTIILSGLEERKKYLTGKLHALKITAV